jgi:chaperonin GroEL (HSP60 family)
MQKVGNQDVITVEEAKTAETELHVVEGSARGPIITLLGVVR